MSYVTSHIKRKCLYISAFRVLGERDRCLYAMSLAWRYEQALGKILRTNTSG